MSDTVEEIIFYLNFEIDKLASDINHYEGYAINTNQFLPLVEDKVNKLKEQLNEKEAELQMWKTLS